MVVVVGVLVVLVLVVRAAMGWSLVAQCSRRGSKKNVFAGEARFRRPLQCNCFYVFIVLVETTYCIQFNNAWYKIMLLKSKEKTLPGLIRLGNISPSTSKNQFWQCCEFLFVHMC